MPWVNYPLEAPFELTALQWSHSEGLFIAVDEGACHDDHTQLSNERTRDMFGSMYVCLYVTEYLLKLLSFSVGFIFCVV